MIVSSVVLLGLLLVAHGLCDYPLQGDFLARLKGGQVVVKERGVDVQLPALWGLFFHSIIHAGAVGVVTGNLYAAVVELLLHMTIDALKVVGATTFNVDQWLHVGCKVGYVGVLVWI